MHAERTDGAERRVRCGLLLPRGRGQCDPAVVVVWRCMSGWKCVPERIVDADGMPCGEVLSDDAIDVGRRVHCVR